MCKYFPTGFDCYRTDHYEPDSFDTVGTPPLVLDQYPTILRNYPNDRWGSLHPGPDLDNHLSRKDLPHHDAGAWYHHNTRPLDRLWCRTNHGKHSIRDIANYHCRPRHGIRRYYRHRPDAFHIDWCDNGNNAFDGNQ